MKKLYTRVRKYFFHSISLTHSLFLQALILRIGQEYMCYVTSTWLEQEHRFPLSSERAGFEIAMFERRKFLNIQTA